MPYIKSGGNKYATVDRLKYLYFRGAVILVMALADGYPTDYKCLLGSLLKAEKEYGNGIQQRKYKELEI